MAKGRKPIPSNIHELRGGSRHTHRPPPKDEPKPPSKIPPCPRHLDSAAKREWKRAAEVMMPLGLLTDLDMMTLASYCEAYSRWVRLCTEWKLMESVATGKTIQAKISNQRILQYQNAYSRWEEATKQVSKGMVYQKPDGSPGFSPYLKIEQAANAQMQSIRKEIVKACGEAFANMKSQGVLLGMSPSSRASLKVTPKEDAVDPHEAFLNAR